MVIFTGKQRNITGQERQEALLLCETMEVFFLRFDIGIVVKYGDAEMVCQPFKHGAGTRTAAAVEKERRTAAVQPPDFGLHFMLVVSLFHLFDPLSLV